jgi:hypothetical protein
MQYSVGALEAPLAVERLRSSDFAKLNPGRIVEMKFLKASGQSYLGPNSGQDAVLFNTYWFVDEAVKLTVFDLFEDVMMRLGGGRIGASYTSAKTSNICGGSIQIGTSLKPYEQNSTGIKYLTLPAVSPTSKRFLDQLLVIAVRHG